MKNILNVLKLFLKSNYYLFKLVRVPLFVTGFFKRRVESNLDSFWTERIALVTQSPDNDYIHRVANAGTIIKDTQIMHNGIRINVGSYYGDGMTVLLNRNRGVHEPQEERAFEEVLNYLTPGSVMIELGSFWGFYSITFQKRIAHARNYLIEPDAYALLSGKHNFKLNGCTGQFYNYSIGKSSSHNEPVPVTCIDDFLRDQDIKHVAVLHSDIQGFEMEMLQGARKSLSQGMIDYLFISTHSNELHADCREFLIGVGFIILCEADLGQTYSWDGVIVAKRELVKGPSKIDISLRHD